MNKSSPNWKKWFYFLAGMNVFILICLIVFLFLPVPETEVQTNNDQAYDDKSSEFIVRTTKENVNDLANAYLEKLLADNAQQYRIKIDEDVQLLGELPLFSATIPLSIHFNPEVQKNGDLVLKQKSIAVGQLKLPNKKIMQYVKKYLPAPEWVVIQPDEQSVYVKLTEMDIKSNFKVGAENFDLDNNIIAFRIHVPYKTLGIDDVD